MARAFLLRNTSNFSSSDIALLLGGRSVS